MTTGMSTKRHITAVGPRRTFGATEMAVVGLLLGITLMLTGASLNFSPALIVGFAAFGISFLYLNTIFWAWVYKKTGEPKPSTKNIPYV